jgi:zinc D-Ala-D-Ala dipeptidase
VNPRILYKRSLSLFAALFFTLPALRPQTKVAPASEASPDLTPGPKPADAPAEWKRHVGIYEYTGNEPPKSTVILLERDQRLYMRYASGKEQEVSLKDGRLGISEPGGREWTYGLFEEPGQPERFTYLNEGFARTDAGSDPSRFYHITPYKPIDELRAAALACKPPLGTRPFRRPDLVELITLDPAIHLDVRYAQSNNFLATAVYTQARAFMQRPAAEALIRALHKLQALGYGLLIHDAYRPWYVTKIFWDATPPEGKIFVADPKQGSKHNRGCAVDLTLYDLATGEPIEMPGLYDEMSPRSFPTFSGGTSLQRWYRDLLRRAMESEGFTVNENEWWHFDYQDWKYYQLINVPFEDLGKSSP